MVPQSWQVIIIYTLRRAMVYEFSKIHVVLDALEVIKALNEDDN